MRKHSEIDFSFQGNSYLKLLRDGQIVHEILFEGTVGQNTSENLGFTDVADHEFETGHQRLSNGNELGVLFQVGDVFLGKLREDADGSGMSDKHPTSII